MKTSTRMLATWVLISMAAASAPAADLPEMGPVRPRGSGGFNFALLPKAFQTNPELEMTVVSEVTAHGRTLPEPRADAPVFYSLHDAGRHDRGELVAEHTTFSPGQFTPMVKKALAVRNYVAADTVPGARPTLQLVYHWGSFYRMDDEARQQFPALARQQFVERAKLVRGSRYTSELVRRLEFGGVAKDFSTKSEHLDEQAINSLYFVIVSAYDYAVLAHGERKLAWRATMTVSAEGVALAESLPPLILTAGDFFGRDMDSPELMLRNVRRGSVKFGEMEVIESGVTLPTPPPTSK